MGKRILNAFGRPIKNVIHNSKGEVILLNKREQRVADYNERICNDLGYQIDITTLTTIIKKITEQKFFSIAPADYLPVKVGEGAWSADLLTYRSYSTGGEFEEGIIQTAKDNARLAAADAAVDALSIKVRNWAKTLGYTIFDLELAAKSGNWDLVTAKESSRKRNWDMGIQRVAFLGARGDSSVLGLLTQAGITPNTTVITKAIKSMTPAELKAFQAAILSVYRANNNYTAFPTHFVMPESDYLGLAAQSSQDFPIKSVLQLLLEAFRVVTGNENFQIKPCAYADAANSGGTLTTQRYALYNYDETSLRMDIPVDYTSTVANSIDNFAFQNVGYGQFTGALAYRPLELMYFDYTP